MTPRSKPRSEGRAELDELTLARAQRGDQRALRRVVERYERPVFAMLSRTLPRADRDTIEDLAQDTFLKVFRALPEFKQDGPARLSTWIFTIATRTAIDHARKKRAVVLSLDDARGEPAMRRPAVGAVRVAEEERAQAVRDAVETLPVEQRAALVLQLFCDQGYAEIARATDVEVGTVKSRIHRAKQTLKALLEGVIDAG